MRKSYELKKVSLRKLYSAVESLSLDGFDGISMDSEIHVEFVGRESLTKTEQKKLDSLMESYIDPIYLEDVRKMREPFLSEADWRFNKAVDANDEEMANKIKMYRNELRDITKQELTNLVWPNKPWE